MVVVYNTVWSQKQLLPSVFPIYFVPLPHIENQ